jgi:molybdopterin-biosynthesis enzyme MoeA-like protein
LSNTLGWDLPPANAQLLRAGIPESIVTQELDKIKHLSASPDVRIYQGVEAVRHPGFGIDIRTDTLERYLESLPDWVSGVIASWNLLYIPDENLQYLARRLRNHS